MVLVLVVTEWTKQNTELVLGVEDEQIIHGGKMNK